ncbi:aminotransferase class V-fold PLP-dependent enzyme [Leifsonia sp. YIM 134122]|uniref:Aminotransferase class V-fold PLP-dependent enzyme n=1 Tax=Leifsonia stereocauli TaxID=3134136 RepID=A0ABU9W095_9MICO
MTAFAQNPTDILDRLAELRRADAPTHGGRVLSYVYDSGLAELDELAAAAIRAVQPLNGLDPTTFSSIAVMERELIGFAREVLHGDTDVVGTITTGGTESCLLAVKTARDVWRAAGGTGVPRLLAATTVHAAFHKAAHYFGLELDLVPVDPATGAPAVDAIAARLDPSVALVVVSAPSYPTATFDPIAEVAALAAERGVACHVDACIGGFALPWWRGGGLPAWDFRLPGVTSISADLHKYGYAPKGASVLLQRGRDRQRMQYFATTRWMGYPVVNPTMLGSKSAAPLAAAWAIVNALGPAGFAQLTATAERATVALVAVVNGIEGLRVVGDPVGPLFAAAVDESVPADRRVDPHRWADAVRQHGFIIQLQPGLSQADGTRVPHSTHLTITPVTEAQLPALTEALVAAADEVRGMPQASADGILEALGPVLEGFGGTLPDSEQAAGLLAAVGIGADGAGLPSELAPLLALIEALPPALAERLLTELLARLVEPVVAG